MIIRCAEYNDLIRMHETNFLNLPENYDMGYMFQHISIWPQLNYVAEDEKGNIVGYVMSKVDEPTLKDGARFGHIQSLIIKSSYKHLGIPKKLMDQVCWAMVECFDVQYIYLRVRKTNLDAMHLYQNLNFKVLEIVREFYSDGEDAYEMRLHSKEVSHAETDLN